MRTRRGHSYSSLVARPERAPKRARLTLSQQGHIINDAAAGNNLNPFDVLPEDLLLSIFVCISSTASSPSDLLYSRRTYAPYLLPLNHTSCRRFNTLANHPLVLAKASPSALKVKASRWCNGSYSYLQQCADAGNIEACYSLGMIRFYCLLEREQGIMLMSRAAKASHACALHSLAVIQFNGSGGTRKHKNLKAGVSFCARAASLGHIDAMRELGHCLQDGYGIAQNVLEGRKLLLEANAREAAAAVTSNLANITGQTLQLTATKIAIGCFHHHFLYQPSYSKLNEAQKAALEQHVDHYHRHPLYKFLQSGGCSLLSDFGCNVPPPKLHISHLFLVEWFTQLCPPSGGLRLCSHEHCGRPETRRHEFRRCSACGSVNYCSRACQALDWKLRHKFVCAPSANWHHRQLINHNYHANNDDNDDVEDF